MSCKHPEDCNYPRCTDEEGNKLRAEIEFLQKEVATLYERWQAKFPELVSVKEERDKLRRLAKKYREGVERELNYSEFLEREEAVRACKEILGYFRAVDHEAGI